MSVTFTCPDAPRKQVPCQFCDEPWADYLEGNGKGGKCDAHCTGFEDLSTAPGVNFANVNAIGILRLLGWSDPDAYLGGSCTGAQMRQRILKARHSNRDALVEAPYELEPGHAGVTVTRDDDGMPSIQRMGPRVISGGNTDEQTLRRLDDLERLACWAQDRFLNISWA